MITSLYVYRHVEDGEKFWVFDFPALGVTKEPFVSGIPEMIDKALAAAGQIHAEERGFVLLFDTEPDSPHKSVVQAGYGACMKLTKIGPESGGTMYRDSFSGAEGWLCPVLNKFFPVSPDTIWARLVEL